MVPEIAAVFSTAANAAKLVNDALKLSKRTDIQEILSDFNSQVIELQGKVMGIGAQYEKLAKVKDDLEKQMVAYLDWDKQAERYELKELAPGILVFAIKPNQQGTDPHHYLCPCCFEKRKRSILQRPSVDNTNYVCHECKFDVRPVAATFPSIQVFPRRARTIDF